VLQEEFDPTINFDLTINFDFFWPNNLKFLHGMSMKFGLWTFHKLRNGRNFLNFALLIMFVLLPEQSRGRPTWSMRGHQVGDAWPTVLFVIILIYLVIAANEKFDVIVTVT